jgi:hypothetical protein
MIITFFFQRQSMLNKYNTPKLNVGSLKKKLNVGDYIKKCNVLAQKITNNHNDVYLKRFIIYLYHKKRLRVICTQKITFKRIIFKFEKYS